MISLKSVLFLVLNISCSNSFYPFGTCKAPLIHNGISLFPSTCQIFFITNTTLSSSSFNKVKVPVVLTTVTTKPNKIQHKKMKKYNADYLLARNARCRIIVLNFLMKEGPQTDLNYFNLHFMAKWKWRMDANIPQ